MLQIKVGTVSGFDEVKNEFVDMDGVVLRLEHSLVSLSKWESKWEIPFLSDKEHTREQVLDYIAMMNLDEEFPEGLFEKLSEENIKEIDDYINAKMTATTINDIARTPNRETVTAEIIYYWMIAMNIPFECQHWHLARLLILVQVVNAKNAPATKMSAADAASERQRLNNERRRAAGSKG